ncbi:MAG: 6,7-dimethyl-8-ribityllumazine synthase [Proteobacteria bacterium]|nr:6,7-dimethyl-8-ribityllumazine synthase [Pseudomonadota bacterium]
MTHILIVSARFYPDIADELERGAVDRLTREGATYDLLDVPGAFEVPAAIRFGLHQRGYDGFLALGCVIRGETSHYDYVCGESARALMELAVREQAAIGYGILTVENEEQAWVRARMSEGNKGRDAAEACLRLIEIKRHFAVPV